MKSTHDALCFCAVCCTFQWLRSGTARDRRPSKSDSRPSLFLEVLCFVISALFSQKYYDQVCQVCCVVCVIFFVVSLLAFLYETNASLLAASRCNHHTLLLIVVCFFAMAGRCVSTQNAVARCVAEFEKDEVSEDREFTLFFCFLLCSRCMRVVRYQHGESAFVCSSLVCRIFAVCVYVYVCCPFRHRCLA